MLMPLNDALRAGEATERRLYDNVATSSNVNACSIICVPDRTTLSSAPTRDCQWRQSMAECTRAQAAGQRRAGLSRAAPLASAPRENRQALALCGPLRRAGPAIRPVRPASRRPLQGLDHRGIRRSRDSTRCVTAGRGRMHRASVTIGGGADHQPRPAPRLRPVHIVTWCPRTGIASRYDVTESRTEWKRSGRQGEGSDGPS